MTKEQLIRIIQDIIPDANAHAEGWESVLNQSKAFPSIFHLYNATKYYVAYFSKNKAINLSLVLYNNKLPVGIMPIMIHQNEDLKWVLSSNGLEVVEPIFIPTLARKVKKRLESQLSEVIYILSSKLGVTQCQFVNMQNDQLTSWYLMWTNKANEVFSTYHLLVDLSLPLEEIRLKFRKSFKPLVNEGLRQWKIEVHEQVSDGLFEKFKLLHEIVAGGKTRPNSSWIIQKKQINSSESFLVTVSSDSEDLVGAGLFSYSRSQGLYFVGAYKRELFDKPIGHPVQLKAIETLKKKGVLWYEIGQKHLNIDRTQPTEKELSISHFKEGFSTHVIARQHLIVNF
jgi:FemAB family protein